MQKEKRKALLFVAATAWMILLAGFLWWYQGRYIRPFSKDQVAMFSGDHLLLPTALSGPGSIRLVHFWDPACPCNVGNQQHLAELIERFSSHGIDFYVVQKEGTRGTLPDELKALKPLYGVTGSDAIPVSPAVAVWDASGRLAYFGPYSEGAICTSSNSFIEPVLEALIAGRPVSASHMLAVGCYCSWAEETRDSSTGNSD